MVLCVSVQMFYVNTLMIFDNSYSYAIELQASYVCTQGQVTSQDCSEVP